jgi:hypothetical protein
MANGFLKDPTLLTHRIQVLVPADGWMKVLECFKSDHVREMDRYSKRFMVLLIDFDGHEERIAYAKNFVPARLLDRVFVLGVLKEPQDLNEARLGDLETIGTALAKDCREETDTTWGRDPFKHNSGEIVRLRERVRPFLFQTER